MFLLAVLPVQRKARVGIIQRPLGPSQRVNQRRISPAWHLGTRLITRTCQRVTFVYAPPMQTLTIHNVRPWNRAPADILIEGRHITSVTSPGDLPSSGAVLDGCGAIALPGLANAHAHVDKTWWGREWVAAGERGDVSQRIAYERAVRGGLGLPNVEASVALLRQMLSHGVTAVRSHVDVDLGVGLAAIEVVREAERALGGLIRVEVVAFPQDGVLRRPGVAGLLDRAAAGGADHVGGIDPATIDRDPVGQLDILFDIAERRGVGVDIHLHDPGPLGAFEIELIADRTLALGLGGRVTVSHGYAIGQSDRDTRERLLDACARAEVGWATAAHPSGTPLPWSEMRERGIPIGIGTDGIRDLWTPFGDGDVLRNASTFGQLHGARTDDELTRIIEMATGNGTGDPQRGLEPGALADIVLVDADNLPDVVARVPARRAVVASGNVVAGDRANPDPALATSSG